MTPARAVALSLALTVLAAWGDYLTTADSAFTLFYVLPLAISVWFVGMRMGYAIIVLSVSAGIIVDVYTTSRPTSWYIIAWNNGAEAVLYITFAYLMGAARQRVANEMKLRVAALDQLRHSERLTTVGKLAAGVAHEIGTPLNVISGYAEMIAGGALSPEETEQSLRAVRTQVDRISRVVRQLLDFSRRAGVGPRKTDLHALVGESIELCRPLVARKNLEIAFSGTSVDATVNRAEIQQVVSNLITNAIHAMPNRGTITLTTEAVMAVPPDAKHHVPKPYARLTVRDEGSGIAPEVLPFIFDPFYTTKDAGEGTGLGLSVSYGIVHDHGGFIAVDTVPGKGSSFQVYIPR